MTKQKAETQVEVLDPYWLDDIAEGWAKANKHDPKKAKARSVVENRGRYGYEPGIYVDYEGEPASAMTLNQAIKYIIKAYQ
jgi:hypothetical protein